MSPDKGESLLSAIPLSHHDDMPEELQAILLKACTSWLTNKEVLALIQGARKHGFTLCQQPPQQPPGELW